MTRKPERHRIRLTHKALSDLLEIERFSIKRWGKRTAKKYLTDIEEGLQLLRENPGILRPLEGPATPLHFYRVNKHVLICDVAPQSTVVLTVLHGSMDVPSRLLELLPQLAAEVAMLHEKLESR